MIILGVMTKDIVYLSLFVTICYNIHFITNYFILMQFSLRMSYGKFLQGIWKELLVGIAMIAAVVVCPVQIDNIFLGFAAKLLYLGLIYVFMICVLREWKILLLKDKR
jgi:hypothetical protein